MLVAKYTDDPTSYLDLTAQETEKLLETSKLFNLSQLVYHCKILDDAMARMMRDPSTKRTTAEFALLRMCRPELDTSGESILARLSKLEDAVALGGGVPSPVSAPAPAAPAVEKTVQAEKKAEPEIKKASDDLWGNITPAAPAAESKNISGGDEYEPVRDISEAVG